jgi:hypothetical protein
MLKKTKPETSIADASSKKLVGDGPSKVEAKAESNKPTDASENSPSQPVEDARPSTISGNPMKESIDPAYLETLVLIIEGVLVRISELGLERKDKEQTVALMKKLLSQTKQRQNKKRENSASGIDEGPVKEIDMRFIHEGFFEEHWLMNSTILTVAQLQFLTPDDIFFSLTDITEEVSPEVTVEKIALLAVCFYAISTEYRFKEKLDELKENADKKTLVQKENTVIGTRFKDIDIKKKIEDADTALKNKKLKKAPEVKNTVPPS